MIGRYLLHPTYPNRFSTLRCCRRAERLGLRALGVLMAITVLQCIGMGLGSSRHPQAQQPAQDTIIATTLFETKFASPPPGPATLSVATVSLAPGQATLLLEGHGSLMLLVESGSVTLLIDHAIDGLPVIESDNPSGPGITYHLRAGQRVTILQVGAMQFRNEGDEASRLLLLTLVPKGGPSLLEISASS
jgi:hypothetical protein